MKAIRDDVQIDSSFHVASGIQATSMSLSHQFSTDASGVKRDYHPPRGRLTRGFTAYWLMTGWVGEYFVASIYASRKRCREKANRKSGMGEVYVCSVHYPTFCIVVTDVMFPRCCAVTEASHGAAPPMGHYCLRSK